MRSRHAAATGLLDVLATRQSASWILAAAFVAAGLASIHANSFLNNEGMLTWIFAGVTSESTLDMLFFLHARPPISLLYAPVATLGLTPFLWVHCVLAALAIPLTASLARHFNDERPNFPAALVALSPLFFAGAAAGVQNTDATVGLLFVTWLLARERAVAAGMVLSLVVLARGEVAVFALALALYAAVTPGCRRFLPAALVIPTAYVLAGALYHGSLLWPLTYPSTATSNPTITAADRAWYGGTLADLVATMLALTPVIGVLAWTSLRSRRPLENTLSMTAIAFVLVIRLLPVTQLIYIDASPRYVLPAQPFLCLAISRAISEWGRSWPGSIVRGALLLGIAILALPWLPAPMGILLLTGTGVWVGSAVLAFRSQRAAAIALVTMATVVPLLAASVPSVVPLLSQTHLFLGPEARRLDQGVAWIGANVPRGGVVVTDDHLLGIWLAKHAPDLGVEVRHLVAPDTAYQMRAMTNPATRQFESFFGTAQFAYARWIFPEEIGSLPGPVFFVMKEDPSPHPRDLSEPPFNRVEWSPEGEWIAGRMTNGRAEAPGASGSGGR